MQDSSGHSISVDGDKFSASIHGSLQCSNCHADIKEYPHPDHIAKVDCKTCHADEGSKLATSVHSSSKEHPCTSCHGNAHEIFTKTDSRSAVYPLNIPKTCGQCHSDGAMATKKGLPSVYPHYMDSIHGFALSKEGLLVAANCQSCHGSHGILNHKDPNSPTFKANIPKTCGSCHAKINDDYQKGAHGQRVAKGDLKAPVCTDCHTTHAITRVPITTTSMIQVGTASRPRRRSDPNVTSVSPNNRSRRITTRSRTAATTRRSTSLGDRAICPLVGRSTPSLDSLGGPRRR